MNTLGPKTSGTETPRAYARDPTVNGELLIKIGNIISAVPGLHGRTNTYYHIIIVHIIRDPAADAAIVRTKPPCVPPCATKPFYIAIYTGNGTREHGVNICAHRKPYGDRRQDDRPMNERENARKDRVYGGYTMNFEDHTLFLCCNISPDAP